MDSNSGSARCGMDSNSGSARWKSVAWIVTVEVLGGRVCHGQ